jgi:predicted exporter
MFVLVLALIGIMTVLETRWRYGLIAVIAVAMALGIRHRLRSKVKART